MPRSYNLQRRTMNPAHKAAVAEKSSQQNGGAAHATQAAPQPSSESPLTQEMLTRFESRAAIYDRENRFFDQDFADLRAAKYLVLPVPAEFGGPGLTLAEVCREQRRLAYYA